MQIVITEFMDEPAVDRLRREFDVRYEPNLVDRRDALHDAVARADAIIVRNRTQVNAALLSAAKALRAVGRLGIGLDNIDVAACQARGIAVLPATGANAHAVAEYVIGTALVLLRGAYHSSAAVAAGQWPRATLSNGLEACERCLGIVGFGGIGRLTAALARRLGMRVIAHDPLLHSDDVAWRDTGVEPLALDALLARADVVTLHIPLNDATRNLLDAQHIGAMKRGAVLINTARGGIIDETALAMALRTGHLRGAAIDVFHQEPLPAGSVLANVPNLVLTPHIAGLTEEANTRVSNMVARRVAQALNGG